eukprot:COSAG06_NODE_41285_length_393_cov_0.595238_1_plen_56_part_10
MPPYYQRMPHQKPGAEASGVGPRGGRRGAVLWAEGLSLSVRVPATGKQSPFSLTQS